ncbi:A/B/D/E cyclin [Clavulina sp. PMI_390]|nr:A/B/D/E cyclin [Clavulina sp. PMI_390]
MAIDDAEPQARTSTRHLHPRSSNGATASQSRRSSGTAKRPTSSRSSRRVKHEEPVEDEAQPVAKKRRTSSVGADDKVAVFEEPADEPVVLDTHLEETKVNAALEEAKWEELDREDDADPLMVSEYVVEIFQYLRKLEIETLPDPLYMNGQPDLAWKMRGILMDWLIQVHNRFRMLPETLFLAVNIVDRFLSVRAVSLVKLQLMGITAMFIASKYEEIMSPALSHYMECTEHSYEDGDILEAEQYILSSIDYNLSYPNPVTFLRRASKADGYDLPTRTVAKYLIEISCVDYRFLPHPPSQVAAAGIWFARLILEKDDWTPTLAHFSGWKEEDIIPVVQLMITYLLRAVKHECFYQKYASKKYMKVSKYVREWLWAKFVDPTLHIVPSPGSVSLVDELPRLREEIRLAREAEGLLLQPVTEVDE